MGAERLVGPRPVEVVVLIRGCRRIRHLEDKRARNQRRVRSRVGPGPETVGGEVRTYRGPPRVRSEDEIGRLGGGVPACRKSCDRVRKRRVGAQKVERVRPEAARRKHVVDAVGDHHGNHGLAEVLSEQAVRKSGVEVRLRDQQRFAK